MAASAKTCCGCNQNFDSLSKCSACKEAQYCSKACQVSHWKTHKIECEQTRLNNLLLKISKNEYTGFMDCDAFDAFMGSMDQMLKHALKKQVDLPPLTKFLNPKRYFENERHKGSKSKVSPCQEVKGIMQYLTMAAYNKTNSSKLDFYDKLSDNSTQAKQQILDFCNVNDKKMNKKLGKFSTLLIQMSLLKYKNQKVLSFVFVDYVTSLNWCKVLVSILV